MTDIKRKIWTLIRGGSFKGYLRTVSGYPLTLTDCMAAQPVSLAVSGNAVQDGTPSPDNPVEVRGVGERTVNLFDKDIIDNTANITRSGDKLLLSGYACTTGLTPEKFLKMIGLKPGDTITVSRTFDVIGGVQSAVTGRISFTSKTGGAALILIHGTHSVYTSVIPQNFSSDNYNNMCLYGAQYEGENGERLVEMYDIQILKGSYTAETLPAYEPYGYKVPARFCSKNLFDIEKFVELVKQYDKGAYEDTIDGRRCIVFTNVKLYNKDFSASIPLAIAKQSTYTLSLNVKHIKTASGSGGLFIGFTYNGNKILNAMETIPTASVTLMPKNYGEFRKISMAAVNNPEYLLTTLAFSYGTNAQWAIDLDSIMLNEGDTAVPYEPYEPYHELQVLPIYLDAPLYGYNGYFDEIRIDTATKNARLVQKIGVLSPPKATSIIATSNTNQTRFNISFGGNTPRVGSIDKCNIAPPAQSASESKPCTVNSGGNRAIYIWILNSYVGIADDDTNSVKIAKANTFLEQHNAKIYYQLATPVTTDISDKIDWDSIPKLWRGTVIATTDTTIEPSDIVAEYYADKPGGGEQ